MRGNSFLPQPNMGTEQVHNVVEQNQPPNQLRTFEPGPPVHHKPPLKKRKLPPSTGVAQYAQYFAESEDPEYAPHHEEILQEEILQEEIPAQLDVGDKKAEEHSKYDSDQYVQYFAEPEDPEYAPHHEEILQEEIPAQLNVGDKKAEEQSKYDSWSDPNISGNPHKTIIVARFNATTSEEKLKGMLKSMENLRKWNALPDELLRLIFKRLPSVLRCLCVCRDWRRVLLEQNWRVIDLRTVDNKSALIILNCLLGASYDLKIIKLDSLDSDICCILYQSAHRIQQLICHDCRGVPPEHLRTLIGVMHNATKIELRKWELADMSMEKTTILSRVETWCENWEYSPLDSAMVNGVQVQKDDLTWQKICVIAEEKLHQPFQDTFPVSLLITAKPNHEFEAWRDDDGEKYLEEND